MSYSDDPPEISIVIPTRNRAQSLSRLLASLRGLLNPCNVKLEVLVVDNGSEDGTASVIEEEKGKFLGLRGIYESMRGQSAAINRGLKECRGEIICLIDDDVVLDPNWIDGLLSSYQATEFDALQGKVLPGVDPNGNPVDPEKLYSYNIPVVEFGDEIKEINGLTGAHMTFKRKVLKKVGLFDLRLGPGASGFSGDTEFSSRIRAANLRIGYTPHAIAYHELDPARYGSEYNRRVHYRKGLSRSIYRQEAILFKIIPNLFVNLIRYGIYRLAGNAEKLHKTEGRILRYWGYLMGRVKGREGGKASTFGVKKL